MKKELRGITWNHSRGYIPLEATAQRFMETHLDINITWKKRSLQEFADYPIQKLAENYDLLVIDHPWAGYAARQKVLLPLEKYLPSEFLEDQTNNSVGKSHESYNFDGFQAALAIDAATPVASYRKDLIEKFSLSVPDTWDDLIKLAKQGLIIFPGLQIDTVMHFYMLCTTLGEDPFLNDVEVISHEVGIQALEMLRELFVLCIPEIINWNPIKVYEVLSTSDDFVYCPFAYSYSNYSREGYSKNLLTFSDMVHLDNNKKLFSTLGGTGLAISSKCQNVDLAVEYAIFVAHPKCQNNLFFENGGQPGHRSAWLNQKVNERSNNFFMNTLAAHDNAFLRPRYSGYLYFQDNAGKIIHEYIHGVESPERTLAKLNKLYQESKEEVQS